MRRLVLLLIPSLIAACDDAGDDPQAANPSTDPVAWTPPPAGDDHVPFAAHAFAYADGTILPGVTDQDGLDAATAAYYDYWKGAYLREGCGDGRRYVLSEVYGDNLTVSEAHGYGMMLLALMAGYDTEARAAFDGMVYYFRDHPANGAGDLMAWFQNSACENAEGDTAATDGDLDIAFALLLADKQWGSCDGIDYRAEALTVLSAISEYEMDRIGQYLLLGNWAGPGDSYYDSTRTSDFAPDHLKSFLSASGDTRFGSVVDSTYELFVTLRETYSPNTGLVPDFVQYPFTGPIPAYPGFLETDHDGAYYNNACRVPWRIGTDFVATGDPRAHDVAQVMNEWIRDTTGGNPSQIGAGYELDGTQLRDWNSLAFMAPFGVSAMVDASNQVWLDALWSAVLNHEGGGYYGDSIKLFSMIVMSGNWWAPDGMPDPCAE